RAVCRWRPGLVLAPRLRVPPVAKAVFLACALASADLALGACWAVPIDVAPDHAGVVSGCMNTLGNLGGLLCPLVIGFAVDRWGSWTFPFYVTAAVYASGRLAWLTIDPQRRGLQEVGESRQGGESSGGSERSVCDKISSSVMVKSGRTSDSMSSHFKCRSRATIRWSSKRTIVMVTSEMLTSQHSRTPNSANQPRRSSVLPMRGLGDSTSMTSSGAPYTRSRTMKSRYDDTKNRSGWTTIACSGLNTTSSGATHTRPAPRARTCASSARNSSTTAA